MQAGIIGNTTRQFSAQNYFQHQSKRQNHYAVDFKRHDSGDIVEFSSNVPKPVERDVFEKSLETSESLLENKKLTVAEVKSLRLDRVYAALVKLEMMKADPGEGKAYWPMGVPAPNDAELEEAYRRLTQKISIPEGVVVDDDSEEPVIDPVNQERIDLLDAFRMKSFSD